MNVSAAIDLEDVTENARRHSYDIKQRNMLNLNLMMRNVKSIYKELMCCVENVLSSLMLSQFYAKCWFFPSLLISECNTNLPKMIFFFRFIFFHKYDISLRNNFYLIFTLGITLWEWPWQSFSFLYNLYWLLKANWTRDFRRKKKTVSVVWWKPVTTPPHLEYKIYILCIVLCFMCVCVYIYVKSYKKWGIGNFPCLYISHGNVYLSSSYWNVQWFCFCRWKCVQKCVGVSFWQSLF